MFDNEKFIPVFYKLHGWPEDEAQTWVGLGNASQYHKNYVGGKVKYEPKWHMKDHYIFSTFNIINAEEIQQQWFCSFCLKLVQNTKFMSGFFQDGTNAYNDSDEKKKSQIDEDGIITNQTDEKWERGDTEKW